MIMMLSKKSFVYLSVLMMSFGFLFCPSPVHAIAPYQNMNQTPTAQYQQQVQQQQTQQQQATQQTLGINSHNKIIASDGASCGLLPGVTIGGTGVYTSVFAASLTRLSQFGSCAFK